LKRSDRRWISSSFDPELNAALSNTDRTEGGRPPFDPVLMFKILVIQAINNLSDERAEFLINDRLSFMRFLGLGLEDRVPDARTIWLFREKLTTAGAIKRLFEQFDAMLRQARYIAMSGQIVDASLVAAPRQKQAGPDPGELEGHAGQAAAQGSRRALDGWPSCLIRMREGLEWAFKQPREYWSPSPRPSFVATGMG
jgi:transposase, IS5 family